MWLIAFSESSIYSEDTLFFLDGRSILSLVDLGYYRADDSEENCDLFHDFGDKPRRPGMIIATWNCNGCFRKKKDLLLDCGADINVIQECEYPEKHPMLSAGIGDNYIWTGLNDNRGLCVFSTKGTKLVNNNWENYGLRHFVSVRVNGSFDLVAVWTGAPYIEEYYVYHQIHKKKYTDKTIVIGDFNSNSIWDKEHKERNHTEVVKQLQEIGLVSAYHYWNNEKQGCETTSTFYLHRNTTKGFHIDYCFVEPKRIRRIEIPNSEDWLQYSDHIPLITEID